MVLAKASSLGLVNGLVILAYLLVIAYLGYLGWRQTRTASDYLIAGRTAHPFIMALSYGATFISTSAIVGFAGVAGMFGMSLLWLAFLNIAVGIFVAFIVLGGPTRRLGQRLNAHTFPEFLGKRYQSKPIHMFAGGVIFAFMPLYASAVLSGGAKFTATEFHVDYDVALLIFALITAAYVIAGGIKAVMYTDTLQGLIMLVGMLVLLVYTYYMVGGVVDGHQYLTDLKDLAPQTLVDQGHRGWTAMPEFGWGAKQTPNGPNPGAYNLWWTIVSAIILGVGIGVLAQPQLIVRFMTVKSRKELNRAVPIGAFFILVMVGVPYVVGPLSNAYFAQHGQPFTGRIVKTVDAAKGHAILQPMEQGANGQWADKADTAGKPVKPIPVVLDISEPTPLGVAVTPDGKSAELVRGRSLSIVYAKGDMEQIMPVFIVAALPRWFGMLFFLTLLSAAMSTLSSQFHVLGTSAGRDLYEQATSRAREQAGPAGKGPTQPNILVVRLAIVLGLIAAVTISHYIRNEAVIARFTAIFFGLCAATFLPAYVLGLFWKRMTRSGALASMVVGFAVSVFWLLLIKEKEAGALGLVQMLTGGKTSILAGHPNWPMVDPVLVALPLSVLAAVGVSLLSQAQDQAHLNRCFAKTEEEKVAA